jgi:hypothetical protein
MSLSIAEQIKGGEITAECLTDLSFYRNEVIALRRCVQHAMFAELEALRIYGRALAQPLFDLMRMNNRSSDYYKEALAEAEADLRMAEESVTIQVTITMDRKKLWDV